MRHWQSGGKRLSPIPDNVDVIKQPVTTQPNGNKQRLRMGSTVSEEDLYTDWRPFQ